MNFEISGPSPEEILGPARIDLISVALQALGTIFSGLIGSGIFLLTVFFLGSPEEGFQSLGSIVLAISACIMCFIIGVINTKIFHTIDPEKYKYSRFILAPSFFINFLLYIVITPIYFLVGSIHSDALLWTFSFHILLAISAQSILTEVLSGYRYVIIGIGSTMISCAAAGGIMLLLSQTLSATSSRLFLLIGLIFIINTTVYTLKNILIWSYYRFYTATGLDPFGNILERIIQEETQQVSQAKQQLEQ